MVEGHRERAEERQRGRSDAVVCACVMVGVVRMLRLVVRDVRGEVELGLGICGEGHAGGDGLGRARERKALEGGLRVDVHVARVGGPARAEGRARATRVALVVLAYREVGVRGARDGEEGIVVCEEIRLADGELKVEDIEELTLDAADVTLAEDSSAERPVDVLEGRVVQVLQARSQYDAQ